MCKVIATVNEAGNKAGGRVWVGRQWVVDVFGEDYIRNLHEQVAYDNQGDTFVKEETNASYTEDSRQVYAIRLNPTLLIFQ